MSQATAEEFVLRFNFEKPIKNFVKGLLVACPNSQYPVVFNLPSLICMMIEFFLPAPSKCWEVCGREDSGKVAGGNVLWLQESSEQAQVRTRTRGPAMQGLLGPPDQISSSLEQSRVWELQFKLSSDSLCVHVSLSNCLSWTLWSLVASSVKSLEYQYPCHRVIVRTQWHC